MVKEPFALVRAIRVIGEPWLNSLVTPQQAAPQKAATQTRTFSAGPNN